MKIIARIRTDFPTKFGIPRQPRLAEHLKAAIVLEPEYRDRNALRGLEGFSHIWLVWHFHNHRQITIIISIFQWFGLCILN